MKRWGLVSLTALAALGASAWLLAPQVLRFVVGPLPPLSLEMNDRLSTLVVDRDGALFAPSQPRMANGVCRSI